MDATIAANTATREAGLEQRLPGYAGLFFVVSVVFQNIVRGSVAPQNGASGTQVLKHFADDRGFELFLFGLFALNIVALSIFIGAVYKRVAGQQSRWATTGLIGAAGIFACFSGVTALEVAMTSAAGRGASPDLMEVLWILHNSLFAMTLAMIATALLGFSIASARAGLVSTSFIKVGALSALLLVAAASVPALVVDGSPVLGIGLIGFLGWLAWVTAASLGLLRAPTG